MHAHVAHHRVHPATHRVHPHSAHGIHPRHAHHVRAHATATATHPPRSSTHPAHHVSTTVVEATVVLHAAHWSSLEASAHGALEASHRTREVAVVKSTHVVAHATPVESPAATTEASHIVHAKVHVLVHRCVESLSSPLAFILALRCILGKCAEGVLVRVGIGDVVLSPSLPRRREGLDKMFGRRGGLERGELDVGLSGVLVSTRNC